jgi:hypothetical protein
MAKVLIAAGLQALIEGAVQAAVQAAMAAGQGRQQRSRCRPLSWLQVLELLSYSLLASSTLQLLPTLQNQDLIMKMMAEDRLCLSRSGFITVIRS